MDNTTCGKGADAERMHLFRRCRERPARRRGACVNGRRWGYQKSKLLWNDLGQIIFNINSVCFCDLPNHYAKYTSQFSNSGSEYPVINIS